MAPIKLAYQTREAFFGRDLKHPKHTSIEYVNVTNGLARPNAAIPKEKFDANRSHDK